MGNDPALVIFAVLFPVMVVGEIVLIGLLWRTGGGRLPRMAPRQDKPRPEDQIANDVWLVSVWLIATALALGLGFVAVFVAVHVLLFVIGTEAAMVGLVASVAFLAAIPVVVALLVHRRARAR